MKVNEKIEVGQFTQSHRPLEDVEGLVNALRRSQKVWSWGASAWTLMNECVLRFKVSGRHHKGHVYLVVNAHDLFDIYYTTTHGRIVKIKTDIYLDCLIETIDNTVEKIPSYKN